ncbi:MAG: DUF5995 family protein [Solirubrobacterales bacterium]
MLKGIAISLLAAAAIVAAVPAPASAQVSYPGIAWSDLLPPVASPGQQRPEGVAHCRTPGLRCVNSALRRLRVARDRFGCDHRGVFATTYMTLTRVFRGMIMDDPGMVRYREYLFVEDALFVNFYFRVLRAWERGDPVPQAWRIALETAESGSVYGAQDMLLGINAHVQNDMPFVIAALGVRTREGHTRKPDHDAVNAVLTRAYEPVVAAVRKRFDPSLDLTNPSQVPIDDMAGLEAVRGWREMVWRHAEQLVNAGTPAERGQVAQRIEAYAGLTAQLIAAMPAPGYRAQRDAYCQSQLGG